MSTEPPKGTLIEVYIVADPTGSGPMSILGVFASLAMATDFVEHETKPAPKPYFMAPERRMAFKWDDGDRVSLFSKDMFGPFELATDYSSEPVRRRRELRKSAAAKLTEEERQAVGLQRG
jgi:hypothetical protein